MSNIGLYKKCQFQLDDHIKQDSHTCMSKLLSKKRIFEIELESVINIKKMLTAKNLIFFTPEKNFSFGNQKPFLMLLLRFLLRQNVFPMYQLAIWTDQNSNQNQTHNKSFNFLTFQDFLLFSWSNKDKASPLQV